MRGSLLRQLRRHHVPDLDLEVAVESLDLLAYGRDGRHLDDLDTSKGLARWCEAVDLQALTLDDARVLADGDGA